MMLVEVGVLVRPCGEWHAASLSFSSLHRTLPDKMVFTATSSALEWLAIFAFRIASSPKTFARGESSLGISFLGDESVQLVAGESVIAGFGEEHASPFSFAVSLEESEMLHPAPESSNRFARESSPHPSGSFIDPEDGFASLLLGDLRQVHHIIEVVRLMVVG